MPSSIAYRSGVPSGPLAELTSSSPSWIKAEPVTGQRKTAINASLILAMMSSSKSAGGVVAHDAQVGAPPGTRGAAGRERWWFKHAATGPHRRGPGVVRIIRAGVSGLPDGVGEGEEIVRAGHGRLVRAGQVNDLPSQGGCQSGRMFGAQIVAMRLCKGRKGP